MFHAHSIRADLKVMRSYLEKGWAQGSYAQNKSGTPCRADARDAVCWCILGAMQIARVSQQTVDFLNGKFEMPVLFNDHPSRTQTEMLAKMDELIQMAPS